MNRLTASGYIAGSNDVPASSNPHTPNGFELVVWLHQRSQSDRTPTWEYSKFPSGGAIMWAQGWVKGSRPWCHTCRGHRDDVYNTGRCYDCYNALYAWKPQREEEM